MGDAWLPRRTRCDCPCGATTFRAVQHARPRCRATRGTGHVSPVRRSPDPRVRADPGRGLRPRPAPGHPGPARRNRHGGRHQASLTCRPLLRSSRVRDRRGSAMVASARGSVCTASPLGSPRPSLIGYPGLVAVERREPGLTCSQQLNLGSSRPRVNPDVPRRSAPPPQIHPRAHFIRVRVRVDGGSSPTVAGRPSKRGVVGVEAQASPAPPVSLHVLFRHVGRSGRVTVRVIPLRCADPPIPGFTHRAVQRTTRGAVPTTREAPRILTGPGTPRPTRPTPRRRPSHSSHHRDLAVGTCQDRVPAREIAARRHGRP